MTKEEKVAEILTRLGPLWPNPKSELNHTNPVELLIATILSAQTTDKLVNTVTPALFARFPTTKDYASATVADIIPYVRKVNFFNNKAKYIQQMTTVLVEQYNGNVPDTMETLTSLPGVARKTANVILGDIFGKQEGIIVDTHVMRLSRLLGLSQEKTPEKIERDLMRIVPRNDWIRFSHLLVLYGRYKCTARMKTTDCPILTDLFIPGPVTSVIPKKKRFKKERVLQKTAKT